MASGLEHDLETTDEGIDLQAQRDRVDERCGSGVQAFEIRVDVVKLPQHVGVPVPVQAQRVVGLFAAVDGVEVGSCSTDSADQRGIILIGQIGDADAGRDFECTHVTLQWAKGGNGVYAAIAAAIGRVAAPTAERITDLGVPGVELRFGFAAAIKFHSENFALVKEAAKRRRCFEAVNICAREGIGQRAQSPRV